jgi:membrane protein DedA with SNARE-associated domain
MADLGNKLMDMVITVSLAFAILSGYFAGAVVTASEDTNLSAYAGLILLIIPITLFVIIKYVWKTGKGK